MEGQSCQGQLTQDALDMAVRVLVGLKEGMVLEVPHQVREEGEVRELRLVHSDREVAVVAAGSAVS